MVQSYIKSNNQRNRINFGHQVQGNAACPIVNSTKLHFGPVLSSDKIETQIGNFYQVDEHFYRGAQPGIDESRGGAIIYSQLKEDLKCLRDKFHIDVVLNHRNHNDNNTNHVELEKQAIKEVNEEARFINANSSGPKLRELTGINIPMHAETIVKSEQVEELFAVFNKYSDKNIFEHCRSGNDRTGVGTGCRRIWKQGTEKGVSFDDICQEMIKCGHNQEWYPRLISSFAACIRYMGITPKFNNITNAKGEKNFLSIFYQNNRECIKSLASKF